jgi:hypothetical protein
MVVMRLIYAARATPDYIDMAVVDQYTCLRACLLTHGWTLGDWLGEGNSSEAFDVRNDDSDIDRAVLVSTCDDDDDDDGGLRLHDIKAAQEDGTLSDEYTVSVIATYECESMLVGDYGRHLTILEKVDATINDKLDDMTLVWCMRIDADETQRAELTTRLTELYLKIMLDVDELNRNLLESGWVHNDQGLGNAGYIGNRLVYIDLESMERVDSDVPVDYRWCDIGYWKDGLTVLAATNQGSYFPGAYESAVLQYNDMA